MTTPRSRPSRPGIRHDTPAPLVPAPRPGGKDPAETSEPYDLPFPDDACPPGRPEYVIVVDQLRGWQPAQPPSLTELLETGPAHDRDPEPEAEP